MTEKKKNGLNISARSFLVAIAVIFVLMVLTYVLSFTIPGGSYARIPDENGNLIIDRAAGYTPMEGGIPFWKWILSPFLVLGASGSGTLIAVIIFLLVVGGVFNSLEIHGLMQYMLRWITHRFAAKRYRLLSMLSLFFMLSGALIGSFEECVPLVPIVVALSVSLGWDDLTGLGMSLLSVGFGFATGVCNPFTVGIAQELAGLPMFSGIWLRLVAFVLIYGLLQLFLRRHTKKVERPVDAEMHSNFYENPKMRRALICFAVILGLGILAVLSSGFLTFLQDYTMILIAVAFLAGGVVSVLVSGVSVKELAETFWHGLVGMLPAVLMILMASSIKFTLEESHVLDTILCGAVSIAETLPRWLVILFIYLIVLVMNFFVGSGSAKAFMLIPLIVPLAQIFGISSQLSVVAFAFGDGFSNVFYPTNAALLISLGLANVSYGKWFRWVWKLQLLNLLLTSALLLFGLAVGY